MSTRAIVPGLFTLVSVITVGSAVAQGLPPVPVPPENPITEAKRVLGKILFWEEQLSFDDTVACGTCHKPGQGSSDDRIGVHPGIDSLVGTPDDVLGSPGVVRADEDGQYYSDPVFALDPQVTPRAAQNFLGNQWAPDMFWDGRARGEFVDPETGVVRIVAGGALESQVVGPPVNDVEMAHEGRRWDQITSKLETAAPLALASSLPPDMASAIAIDPTYPELFEAAFGTAEINATRIAFAIATYERTLIPDQTPWDRFIAGDAGALTGPQQQGWQFFRTSPCGVCHQPPFFTDSTFRNIGLRPIVEDAGRSGITGIPADRGRFKVPSLRGVGLRDRLMHTGRIEDVEDAIEFYARLAGHVHFPDNQDPLVRGGIPIPPGAFPVLLDFLTNGLTDPRQEAEAFPFDRPVLRSEIVVGAGDVAIAPVVPGLNVASWPNPFRASTTLTFDVSDASVGPVEVSVFSASGALVRSVSRAMLGAGSHEVVWDGLDARGRSVAPGVYFYRLTTRSGSALERLVKVE